MNNPQWTNVHSNIFEQLISEFNTNNIRYFVLRNYEGLPEINNSKDIDIIIAPNSYKTASNLLKKVFLQNNVTRYKVVKYEKVRCWYGMNIEKGFSIHIDLIEGYLSKGFEILPFDLLYENTTLFKNFRVLRDDYDAAMLLYYKVIGSKQLKEAYKEKILKIYNNQTSDLESINQKVFGLETGKLISDSLAKADFESLIKHASKMSVTSKRISFLKSPLKTTVSIFKFFCDKFYRIVVCPRKFQNFIAVLGPDGTGKSTFIEGLQEKLAFYYVADDSKFHVYHFRPTLLPNLAEVGEKAKIKEQDKDFTNPHRAKPANRISSLIRMVYYWLDYLIGVPLLLRKDVQFDRFTIYDRYIYDFLIDPRRSRINLPYSIRKCFTLLVPQPRLVFVLSAKTSTIYARKQELTMDEIERQLGEYGKLEKTNKRFIRINAELSPDEVVDQAVKVIIENFTLSNQP